MKNYQTLSLPADVEFAAATPELTEKSILPQMRETHLAPRGKYGLLRVLAGNLQFVMEDEHETFDADVDHPIVIPPERPHHVKVTGPVRFKVEFYKIPRSCEASGCDLPRPGEAYCSK